MTDLRGANTMIRCRPSLTQGEDSLGHRYKLVLKNELCNSKKIIITKNYLRSYISRYRLANY